LVVIDPGSDKGARVSARLRDELVLWLVTVSADGTPVPTPVWFLWDGESLLVYSQRDKPKLRHIAANPRVALAMRTDEHGDLVAVITGDAAVDESTPPCDQVPGYIEKYAASIVRLGADVPAFAGEYSVPIRVRPTKLRFEDYSPTS
jgi:PPOX class probable F420-dependent enzyme